MEQLHSITHADGLISGTIVERSNRFVVRVQFDAAPERVYLADPGELEGIVEPGHDILCLPVGDPDRATDYDAISVQINDVHVSVRTALANDLFESAIKIEAIPAFHEYEIRHREPSFPEHGRADFLLDTPAGETAFVEVKSCTYVDGRTAKFPDRQTERGRRHLRSLETLSETGVEAHVVFVIQRPDVDDFVPYREIDPEFANLLHRIRGDDVGVHAITTLFDPPQYRLANASLPVRLDE